MAKQDISVRQLVDKVISRELALPEMQRRYVWTAVKVRDLLDSLYRGYPSGAILVWEADPTMDDRSLQVQGISSSPLSGRLLLLDGQQRLTSLTAILTGKPVTVRNKRKPIEILFNLDHPDSLTEDDVTEVDDDDDDDDDDDGDEFDLIEELRRKTFVVSNSSLRNDPRWISVSEVFVKSESQLLKPLNINSDHPNWDRYSERIRNLRKIQDYQYVMQILDKRLSYEEVTEIFVRVNSLGAKLRGSDLALAQITSKWRGFITEIDRFAKEFEHNEDYLLDTGILVKTLVVFATGQSRFKTVSRVKMEHFEEAWKKAQVGLRFAINLLKNNARIENLRLLGSPFLLIPIAYYAVMRNERLSTEEVNKLMLWFYVSHMKSRYGVGSSETILDSDVSILSKTQSLDQLLDQLKFQVKNLMTSVEEIRGKTRRSNYFTMLFFIAKQQGIKDWFTGMSISEKLVGRAHALQFHHIFPKSILRKAGRDRKEINDIANLAFIGGKTNRNIGSKEPKKYLQDVVAKRGDEVLKHHSLPEDRRLWELENYQKFLAYRRKEFVSTINQFIGALSK